MHCGARAQEPAGHAEPRGHHNWIHRLPFKMRFKKSKIYLSVLPIIALGFSIGMLTSVMGIGGGFIMVPAMIYLLRIPTSVVIGTSLFQIIFVTAYTTMIQATMNQYRRYRSGRSIDGLRASSVRNMACASARSCAPNNCARFWRFWCLRLACDWPSIWFCRQRTSIRLSLEATHDAVSSASGNLSDDSAE